MTLPNVITVLRICLVPVLVWCIGSDAWNAAFWIFAAAGVSDGIDGFIAKRFDQRSELGAMLDPLADKVLWCRSMSPSAFSPSCPAGS